MKKLFGLLLILAIVLEYSLVPQAAVIPKGYQLSKKIGQLVVVKYKKNSQGTLTYYEKNAAGKWKKKMSCKAWLGRNGIDKKREGDGKTPRGKYALGQSFGILKNPGTKMPYRKVDQKDYWCSDSGTATYNRLIRNGQSSHRCSGEQLARYKGSYDYGIFIEYNKNGTAQKGSAIFLHCSKNKSTAGCVAIPKNNMKKLLKKLNPSKKPMIIIDK